MAELPRRAHAVGGNGAGVGRDEIHQAEAQRLHARVRGDFEGVVHRQRRFDEHVQRQLGGIGGLQRGNSLQHIGHRFDLGHHQVAQAMTGASGNGDHVAVKGRMVDRVHAHADAHAGPGGQREFGDERGMLRLAAHGGAVFAIEGDVEHAGAELLGHLGLEREALLHARLDAAVVVAHGQRHGAGLRAQQHFGGMDGFAGHALPPFCATMNMRGNASSLLPSVRAG